MHYKIEKELDIQKLNLSSNFATTHAVISKLNTYSEFTVDQLNSIVNSYINNNQIYWIISDPDVNEFIHKIIKGRENEILEEYSGELDNLLSSATDVEQEE